MRKLRKGLILLRRFSSTPARGIFTSVQPSGGGSLDHSSTNLSDLQSHVVSIIIIVIIDVVYAGIPQVVTFTAAAEQQKQTRLIIISVLVAAG